MRFNAESGSKTISYASVVSTVTHTPFKRKVEGSNPFRSTKDTYSNPNTESAIFDLWCNGSTASVDVGFRSNRSYKKYLV